MFGAVFELKTQTVGVWKWDFQTDTFSSVWPDDWLQEQTIWYWEVHVHAHLSLGISKIAFCPVPAWRESPFQWHCSSFVIFLLWCYYPKYILGPWEGNPWACAPTARRNGKFSHKGHGPVLLWSLCEAWKQETWTPSRITQRLNLKVGVKTSPTEK